LDYQSIRARVNARRVVISVKYLVLLRHNRENIGCKKFENASNSGNSAYTESAQKTPRDWLAAWTQRGTHAVRIRLANFSVTICSGAQKADLTSFPRCNPPCKLPLSGETRAGILFYN
jgi:hypothetical protein